MDTNQKNNLIAKFMGLTLRGGVWINEDHNQIICTENKLTYHCDYNSIMNVVSMIENTMGYSFDIFNKAVSIQHKDKNEMIVDINGKDFNSKLDSIYHGCFFFILWFNHQNIIESIS